jgi:hypothetical protein
VLERLVLPHLDRRLRDEDTGEVVSSIDRNEVLLSAIHD